MKRNSVILFIAVVFGALATILITSYSSATKQYIASLQNRTQSSVAGAVTLRDTVSVRVTGGEELSYTFRPEESLTALDALRLAATDSGVVLETKEYDFGVLVEKIGSLANGTADGYWIFYVNGEQAAVGVGQYTVRSGDRIEFVFEKLDN
ncbi:MAG: DUF4430 domain-containing protein [bacterium]|nr:DUF4430 domain-containing protein [bacterium]